MSKKIKPYPGKKDPRALTDIQKEYQELCFKAGQLQYQNNVTNDELAKINERLYEVNYEAAERNKLDAESSKQAAPEVTNG